MKKILFTIIFLMASTVAVVAQVRVGAFVGYTTAPDHNSPNLYRNTSKFFPGFTASFEKGLPKGFSYVVDADVTRTPQLPSLFTTDEGEHAPSAEVRVHPRIKFNFGTNRNGCGEIISQFFVAAGADAFYHFIPNPEHEKYSLALGVNPTATAGVKFVGNEASVTYLFKDKRTDLYGYRANLYRNFGKFRVGLEANRLKYKERNREGYVDPYYETDNVFKLSFTIPLGR